MKKNVSNKEVLIVCPFFKYNDPYHIGCEGVCGGTTLSVNFKSPQDKDEYKDRFCRNIENYHKCRVCEMLEAKYVDDGK